MAGYAVELPQDDLMGIAVDYLSEWRELSILQRLSTEKFVFHRPKFYNQKPFEIH